MPIVAERLDPSQSTRPGGMGSSQPTDVTGGFHNLVFCILIPVSASAWCVLKDAFFELGPTDRSPCYRLGLTYQKLGPTELAREVLDRMQHLKQSSKP
jgi:hypothetical protein